MSKMFFTFKWGKGGLVTQDDLKKILLRYYTKEEVDALLKKYATIEDVAAELVQKVDNVEFEEFKEEIQSLLDEKAEQVWVEQEIERLEGEIGNIPETGNLAKLNEENTFEKTQYIKHETFTGGDLTKAYYFKDASDNVYGGMVGVTSPSNNGGYVKLAKTTSGRQDISFVQVNDNDITIQLNSYGNNVKIVKEPTEDIHLTTKKYVDEKISGAGGGIRLLQEYELPSSVSLAPNKKRGFSFLIDEDIISSGKFFSTITLSPYADKSEYGKNEWVSGRGELTITIKNESDSDINWTSGDMTIRIFTW